MKSKLGLLGVALIGGSAFAADGIKLGGFADAAYTWAKGTPNTNTFGVVDGSLYIGKTMGMGEVLVDMPFAYNPYLTGIPNGGANISAGFTKAQAWVSWKYENGFNWKLGQFDSLYGFESNDSVDRFFAQTGIVYAGMPVVHTGLNVGYDFSDALGLSFLVSNPADHGAMTGGNPDFGFKINSKMDAFTASVGGLFQRAAATGSKTGWLFDIQAGTKVAQLKADLEVSIAKAGGATDTSLGLLGHFVYDVSETIAAGLRAEFSKAGTAKTTAISVGPNFNMNKDFSVRLAYAFTKVSGASTTGNGITIDAIHRF